LPQLSIKVEEILSLAHGKFVEQNKVPELSIIIVNYILIICNEYYNYIINSQYNYYIFNNGHFEEGDKGENLEENGAAAISCHKSRL
jgi:hypothetical protein